MKFAPSSRVLDDELVANRSDENRHWRRDLALRRRFSQPPTSRSACPPALRRSFPTFSAERVLAGERLADDQLMNL